MVLMLELHVVVSADTADIVRFPLLFFACATWVAAWEAGIFPAVCRVRRGAATLDGALRDEVEASLSLPTVELETYSSMGGGGAAHPPRHEPCSCAGPRRAAMPGTSRCPRGAAKQDVNTPSEPRRVLTETHIGKRPRSKTHRVGGAVHP
jgi:hypothetical protein